MPVSDDLLAKLYTETHISDDWLAKLHIQDLSKEDLLRYILKRLKANESTLYIKSLIRAAREEGRDYPEFKVIEKSMGENA